MARRRVAAVVRKAQAAAAAQAQARERTAAQQVADGVRGVGEAIAPLAHPGSLWWLAPVQFVAEQMAVRVCDTHTLSGLTPADRDEVAGYLMAALQEFVHALAADFDVEHFRAWASAMNRADGSS